MYGYDYLTFSSPLELELSKEPTRLFAGNKGNGWLFWYDYTGLNANDVDFLKKVRDDDELSISRLDIKRDLELEKFQIDMLFNIDFDGIKWLECTGMHVSNSGRTVYFGKGDFLIRVYEKGKQLNKELGWNQFPENLIRCEFQLRGRKIRNSNLSLEDAKYDFDMLHSKYFKDNIFGKESDVKYNLDTKKGNGNFCKNVVLPYLKKININELDYISQIELKEILKKF